MAANPEPIEVPVDDAPRQRSQGQLRDDERVMRTRREWYRLYQDGELPLEGLRKKAPLMPRAVEKQRQQSK